MGKLANVGGQEVQTVVDLAALSPKSGSTARELRQFLCGSLLEFLLTEVLLLVLTGKVRSRPDEVQPHYMHLI